MKLVIQGMKLVTFICTVAMAVAFEAQVAAASGTSSLIVGFKEDVSERHQEGAIKSAGATPDRSLEFIDGYVIEPGRGGSEEVADRLRRLPDVAYVEDDPQLELDVVPNDPVWAQSLSQWHWALQNDNFGTPDADIDATEAWNVSTGSRDVVIAVIDTGADYFHPDMRGNIWVNPGEVPSNGLDDDGDGLVDNVYGYDHGDNDSDPNDEGDDDTGHGTGVGGIIGAVGNNGIGMAGVNWQVQVMPLKYSGTEGGIPGASRRVSDMLEALQNAISEGVFAINMSFGGGAGVCGNASLQAGMNAAEGAGILVVASAGNDGVNTDVAQHCPSSFPNANIISVANSDENDSLTATSNFGAVTVDLAAPGREILSLSPGGSYAYSNGTSFSAPMVAGAAGLVKAVAPQASAAQVRDAILGSVDQKPQLAGRVATGGRLNVFRAMQQFDRTGPSGKIKLNRGSKYSRRRKISLAFQGANDDSGLGTVAVSIAGKPLGDPVPFATKSTIKLNKKQGKQTVEVALADRLENSISFKKKITYDRTRPRKFRIESVKVKRKRGSRSRRVVIRWRGAKDKLSGVKKYRIYRGGFRRSTRKGSGRKRKSGGKKRCHLRKVKVVSRKRRETVVRVRARGRQCFRLVAVDRAGNERRSRTKRRSIR